MSLIRLWNAIFALACVFVGFSLAAQADFTALDWFLALGISGLIFAGGNALNDCIDTEIDKSAHPSRPIPSGAISRRDALFVSWGLLSGGVVLSALAIVLDRNIPGAIGLISAFLIITYDYYLKKIPLAGNITIGILGGAIFVFAGSFGEINARHLFAAGFALLFHIAREIVKDIADLPAEEASGIRTFPAKVGVESAARLATVLLVAIVPITIVPFFLEILSLWYLGAVILFADLPIILFAWLIPQSTTPRRAEKIAHDLKWIMAGGLFSLYIGGITI